MTHFIETKDLHVSYGKLPILRGVSISVENGAFVGLLGPNGSGKSTLLKSIYRVKDYDRGSISMEGRDLKTIPLKESAKLISVVQQVDDMPFDFTVFDMVIMGRTPYKKFMERDTEEDRKITYASIEKAGLKGYEERSIHSLSGGERQRVIVARALAQNAKGMILDEPTNHLDIRYQLSLMRLVKSTGNTCLCALHDINMAFMFCDYVYAMKEGKIVAEGTPDDCITASLIEELYGVRAKILTDEETKRNYVLFLEQ